MLEKVVSAPIPHVDLRPMICLTTSETCREAVIKMAENRRGSVVVVNDEGRLVGIFTERDVLLQGGDGLDGWLERRLGEAMTPQPNRAYAGDTINDALQVMKTGGFRHLPVVDDDDRPVAVLSIRDILAYVVEHYPQEFINLPPSPTLEASKLYGG